MWTDSYIKAELHLFSWNWPWLQGYTSIPLLKWTQLYTTVRSSEDLYMYMLVLVTSFFSPSWATSRCGRELKIIKKKINHSKNYQRKHCKTTNLEGLLVKIKNELLPNITSTSGSDPSCLTSADTSQFLLVAWILLWFIHWRNVLKIYFKIHWAFYSITVNYSKYMTDAWKTFE